VAFERVRGLERLTPLTRTRVCRLSIWREQEAQRLNIPRAWITDDGGLERMAKGPFPSPDIWPRIVHPNVRTLPDFAQAEAIATATDLEARFIVSVSAAPSEAEKKRLEQLRKALQPIAASLALDESFLCPVYTLKALARGGGFTQHLSGWRAAVLAPLKTLCED